MLPLERFDEIDLLYLQDVCSEATPPMSPAFYMYFPATHDLYQIDTSNVLFIFSGAFVGLENVTQQRLAKGVSLFDYTPFITLFQIMSNSL